MAELAVTDGMPPPDDLPRGECIMTTLYDEEGRQIGARIDRADPRILISAELLDGELAPCAVLRERSWPPRFPGAPHTGATLKITGINRTVVYRIVDYIPRVRGYVGEWPD